MHNDASIETAAPYQALCLDASLELSGDLRNPLSMDLNAGQQDPPSYAEGSSDPLDDLDALLTDPSAWDAEPLTESQLDLPVNAPLDLAAPTSGESPSPRPDSGPGTGHPGQASKADRKLAMSREVQKRFRQRQKVTIIS